MPNIVMIRCPRYALLGNGKSHGNLGIYNLVNFEAIKTLSGVSLRTTKTNIFKRGIRKNPKLGSLFQVWIIYKSGAV
jgi:hypothetical protein